MQERGLKGSHEWFVGDASELQIGISMGLQRAVKPGIIASENRSAALHILNRNKFMHITFFNPIYKNREKSFFDIHLGPSGVFKSWTMPQTPTHSIN